METLLCPWESPIWFLFSSNLPLLLPYSHFISFVASILLAIFLFKSHQQSFGKIFLIMCLLFSSWVLIDWHIWATNRSDVVMFLWSIQILTEILIYSYSLYLTLLFINNEEPKTKYKYLGMLGILPIILLLPTEFILKGIDLSYCDALENSFIVIYSYTFEAIIMLLIIHTIAKGVVKSKKGQGIIISLFGFGIITFLLAFTSGNIIGSITENWEYAQFGLFGMPIFMGILSYSIMKYRAFNTKTFGAQILVAILLLLTTGILFLRTIERVRIVTSITLFVVFILGYILVRSVEHEVEQREKIEKLAGDLEIANAKLKELDQMKSEFLSLATHQIRAPLTAIKGYSSMLLEGDFGVLPQKARDSIETIFKSCQNLINIVGDFLNISRIEQGRMVYEKSIFNIVELAREVAKELAPNIQKAGLTLKTEIKEGLDIKVNADFGKIKQVIGNILDNAIKYTLKGSIKISIDSDNKNAYIKIKDSGVGIDPKEIDKLFAKFTRAKDANKTNVIGTGLGLYIAKKMIEAHHGDIKIESEGVGKGTTFIIQIPKIISS